MPRTEKRSCKRKTYNAAVDYSVSISKNISKPHTFKTITISETVKTVDISKKGLGIITSYPVMPDHILKLRSLDGKSLPKTAVVRWRAKKGIWYRVGLMFI